MFRSCALTATHIFCMLVGPLFIKVVHVCTKSCAVIGGAKPRLPVPNAGNTISLYPACPAISRHLVTVLRNTFYKNAQICKTNSILRINL